jgi:hypothetical protein
MTSQAASLIKKAEKRINAEAIRRAGITKAKSSPTKTLAKSTAATKTKPIPTATKKATIKKRGLQGAEARVTARVKRGL